MVNFWPMYGQGGASGLYFFIDARDRTAGGRVGGRMSRAPMKKKGEHPFWTRFFDHIFPEHARLFPALAGFAPVLNQNGRKSPPHTRAAGQDDDS